MDSYGFVALGLLKRFAQLNSQSVSKMVYVGLHSLLVNSRMPNCTGSHLVVPSGLNLSLWEYHLKDYWDHQLIFYLKYGFPIDLHSQQTVQPQGTITNHSSAVQHPISVQLHISTENKFKTILGPFQKSPIQNLHCPPSLPGPSPTLTGEELLLILASQKGALLTIVLTLTVIWAQHLQLKFPTVDNIVDIIVEL